MGELAIIWLHMIITHSCTKKNIKIKFFLYLYENTINAHITCPYYNIFSSRLITLSQYHNPIFIRTDCEITDDNTVSGQTVAIIIPKGYRKEYN
ncbi:MAG: hypothetical protein K0R34_3929 [Herbinix sp.]|nr:hypothetical protein [Herbinix sp.]